MDERQRMLTDWSTGLSKFGIPYLASRDDADALARDLSEAAAEIENLSLDLTRAREAQSELLADLSTTQAELAKAYEMSGEAFRIGCDHQRSAYASRDALNALRARVVEVGRPFAESIAAYDAYLARMGLATIAEGETIPQTVSVGELRALSNLVKEVESGT